MHCGYSSSHTAISVRLPSRSDIPLSSPKLVSFISRLSTYRLLFYPSRGSKSPLLRSVAKDYVPGTVAAGFGTVCRQSHQVVSAPYCLEGVNGSRGHFSGTLDALLFFSFFVIPRLSNGTSHSCCLLAHKRVFTATFHSFLGLGHLPSSRYALAQPYRSLRLAYFFSISS